jgi:ATP-dependent metalloprotease
MDGFKETDNIIIIGATNFQKSMDPAILRPGRFDKTIQVPLPDVRGRQNIFEQYLKGIKHNKIDSEVLAKTTTGFSGADIENMVNVAILQAIR